jgi:hypothetical protein
MPASRSWLTWLHFWGDLGPDVATSRLPWHYCKNKPYKGGSEIMLWWSSLGYLCHLCSTPGFCRDCMELSMSRMAGLKPPGSSPFFLKPLAVSSIGNYIIHLRSECSGFTPTYPIPGSTHCSSGHAFSTHSPIHPWTGLRVPLLRHWAHSDWLSTLWGTTSVPMRQLPKFGYFDPEATSWWFWSLGGPGLGHLHLTFQPHPWQKMGEGEENAKVQRGGSYKEERGCFLPLWQGPECMSGEPSSPLLLSPTPLSFQFRDLQGFSTYLHEILPSTSLYKCVITRGWRVASNLPEVGPDLNPGLLLSNPPPSHCSVLHPTSQGQKNAWGLRFLPEFFKTL